MNVSHIQNALKLTSGSAGRQAASLFLLFLTYQLFDLKSIGEVAVVISSVAIFSVFTTFRIENAIFSVPGSSEVHLFFISICLALFVSLLAGVISLFFTGAGVSLGYLLFVDALGRIYTKKANIEEMYGKIAVFEFVKVLSVIVFVVACYFAPDFGLNYLLLSYCAGWSVSLILIASAITSPKLSDLGKQIRFISSLRDFYIYGVSGSFVSKLQYEAPVILASIFIGDVGAAKISAAKRLIVGPLGIFAQSLSYIYIKEFSKNDPLSFALKYAPLLVSLVLALGCYLIPEKLFSLIFNEGAGEIYTLFLAFVPLLLGRTFAVPLATWFQVARKQKLLLCFQVLAAITSVGALYLSLSANFEFNAAILIFSFVASFFYFLIGIKVLSSV